MSEQFTSKQDRDDAIDTVKDFVTVDTKGNVHIPAGSGTKSGDFLSNHELKMIEAHEEQIHAGMANRMTEEIEDAVGILTDPKEIRDSLYVHGFLDDDEMKTWSDEDVMSYVNDARKEVRDYYAAYKTADTSDDSIILGEEYVPKHRADLPDERPTPEQYVGRHAAINSDEDSPIFDELNAQVRENESLDEYEARQQQPTTGRHRLEKASTDGLDVIDAPSGNPLEKASTDGLDVIDAPVAEAAREADSEQATKSKLSWRDRLRRLASPAGLAAELSAGMHSTKEKLGNHKKAALGLGILAVAGSLAALYLTRDSGGSGAPHNGGALKELLTPPTGPKDPNATKELLDSSAWNIPKGSGGEALMERLGADKSTWYQHQNEFLNQFPGEAYRMPDGNVGFDDPGRLSKGAIKFWAKYASK